MKIISLARRAFIGLFPLLFCAPLEAAVVRGQLRAGYSSRGVEFKQPVSGETSNDESVINLQAKVDVSEFNSSDDRLLFDIRDKYDSYGKLERQNLRLSSYNRMVLRQAAYQRPWESNRLYFTAGRFALPEANIMAHDGADVGYRFTRSTRVGAFAGLGPADVLTPLYVDPGTTEVSSTQLGSYLTYEDKQGVEDSTYMSNAVAIAPSYLITDADSHTYFYHQSMLTFTSVHRVSGIILQDISPSSTLRRAYGAYTYLTERYRATAAIQQTSTEDYLVKQTLQDNLAPSSVRSIDLSLRQRFSSSFALDYSASYGTRSVDGKTRTELAFGVLLPKLLSESGSGKAQLGKRSNFTSDDTFFRFGYDYWSKSFGGGLSHLIVNEDYRAGGKNSRQITTIDGGFFVSDDIRGSVGYQLETDDQVSANALFLMLGYRFGVGSVSPVHTKPPRFESF